MLPLVVRSQAKINLFLAITGRRTDGFHELISVAAPIQYGDTLSIEPTEDPTFALTCDHPELAVDETNLVLRAARAFRRASGCLLGARLVLTKRIPLGAGLGGGSSNASATLRGLNTLAGGPLGPERLSSVAAELGSDCPLFLEDQPVVIRGRGERVVPLPEAAKNRLSGRRLLVFKPWFGIDTAWAFRQMAAGAPESYLSPRHAEERLNDWLSAPTLPAESLIFNHMETAVFAKFRALPALLAKLRAQFGLTAGMTGSGSACYALLTGESAVGLVVDCIRDAWGDDAFVIETRIG